MLGEKKKRSEKLLINQTNMSNRCHNAVTASQGHDIQGNAQFVTGNGFKWHIRWRSAWIYTSPDKGGNGSEWDVLAIMDASESVCCVAMATTHRHALPLEESVKDVLTPGCSFEMNVFT